MRKLKTVASLLLAVVITGLSAITPAFADYDPGFDVDAEAVYFINLDTGKVIYEKGNFFFFGDFNVQQIPFYRMAHDAVRSG